MKVLFVSAEVAPFSSVGGLAKVSYFLPRALLKKGIDVRIFTPKYGVINETKYPTKMVIEGLKVPTGEAANSLNPKDLICNVKTVAKTKKGEPKVYFLENMEYYEKRANVYNYSDDHIRFGLLSRGALEFIKKKIFVPDLIHCNDWHTSYLIDYLRSYKQENTFKKIATLLSVHNLFQGIFDFDHALETDFDDGRSSLSSFYSDRFFKQNPLKRGILYSDIINTVSENFSREITREEYGGKLHNLFRELRGKLFGILNGLDYADFDPRTDSIIKQNYSLANLGARSENKIELQKEFNLKVDPAIPILAISERLDPQKGIDLILGIIEFLLKEFDVQFIALGACTDDKNRESLLELENKYPKRVGTHLMQNFVLPRKIFAGADALLIPSRYEPGGIVALEAMRYGCIPIVRATGGLADSVINFDYKKDIGTGFSFEDYSAMSFLTAIVRTLETYKNKVAWTKIIRRAMQQDFSWNKSADKYLELYQKALKLHKEKSSTILPIIPTINQ